MAIAYKPAGLNITTDTTSTAAEVYACPTGKTAIVKTILVANTHASSSVNATILWTDSSNSNTSHKIANAIPVPANTTLTILAPGVLVLEAGDTIKAQSSNASGYLDITVALQEIG